MDIIHSQITTTSAAFQQNMAHNQTQARLLHQRLQTVREGGGERAVALHRRRNKLLARERIDALLDPGAPFLELSPLAAYDMYDNAAPAAGIVTGIGVIHGSEVMIVANDATVKGGTYFFFVVAFFEDFFFLIPVFNLRIGSPSSLMNCICDGVPCRLVGGTALFPLSP